MTTEEILVNPSNKSVAYFESSQWASEPCYYCCLDRKECKGGIHTGHGYWLACLLGCKKKKEDNST